MCLLGLSWDTLSEPPQEGILPLVMMAGSPVVMVDVSAWAFLCDETASSEMSTAMFQDMRIGWMCALAQSLILAQVLCMQTDPRNDTPHTHGQTHSHRSTQRIE